VIEKTISLMTLDQMRQVTLQEDQLTERVVARAALGWGQCTNLTEEMLAVYGPKVSSSPYDNALYCLPPYTTTPQDWDCDGFYVPTDRVANQAFSRVRGPLAIKYPDFVHFRITQIHPGEYDCAFNEAAFRPREVNWPIPYLTYSEVLRLC
jgi:hypothetical protein